MPLTVVFEVLSPNNTFIEREDTFAFCIESERGFPRNEERQDGAFSLRPGVLDTSNDSPAGLGLEAATSQLEAFMGLRLCGRFLLRFLGFRLGRRSGVGLLLLEFDQTIALSLRQDLLQVGLLLGEGP